MCRNLFSKGEVFPCLVNSAFSGELEVSSPQIPSNPVRPVALKGVPTFPDENWSGRVVFLLLAEPK